MYCINVGVWAFVTDWFVPVELYLNCLNFSISSFAINVFIENNYCMPSLANAIMYINNDNCIFIWITKLNKYFWVFIYNGWHEQFVW